MQRYTLPIKEQQATPGVTSAPHSTPTPAGFMPVSKSAPVRQDWSHDAPVPVQPKIKPVQAPPHPQTHPQTPPRVEGTQEHHDTVLFVRGVLNEGIRRGASDVHFEPRSQSFRIRFRIDGILSDFVERPMEDYEKVVSAVKVLADLDIAEHVIPQDGHIELVLQQIDERAVVSGVPIHGVQPTAPPTSDRYYDIRVSFFPSVNGEVLVMRILNRASALLSVEELGMDAVSLERLRNLLLTSYGMVLITGPTGSGKTTTLYSVMSELKSEERNIITLEDPIEFHLDWMRQCEIREERGFTFERAMASVLRQDPDILMVGEIRDPATAEYAVRSALVGRIVGSTIHANTTIGTIARLLDLGISRSLVANSIQGIVAQRLVRRICEKCKVPYTPQPAHLAHFGLDRAPGPFYRGSGCAHCSNTGYKGRTGIFSVLLFSDEIRALIFEQHSLTEVQDLAIQQGMRTLKMDAALKISAGITTVEEAIHVV